MSFGAPKPPDPYATAAAQSQANAESIRQAAQYNQINQTNPFGSLTYTGDLGSPDRTAVTALSPELQNLLNTQLGVSQGLSDLATQRMGSIPTAGFQAPTDPNTFLDHRVNTPLQRSFDLGGSLASNVAAGPIQTALADAGPIQKSVSLSDQPKLPGVDDFSAERQRVEDALYNRAASRLDPRFSQAENALQTRLANQGITQGSDAYATEMANFNRDRNDAYSNAVNDAILAGGGEQSRMFGLGLAARQQGVGEQFGLGNFANQAQAQQFGQNLGAGQFANQAQNQGFQQGMANAQLQNQAAMQNYARNLGAAQLNNQALGQNFQQGMQVLGFNQDEYQRQLSNAIQGRNQDFNELAAFLNGSPIAPNNPTFQPQAQYSPMGVPIADLIQGNYQTQANANAGLMGGLFGLGGTLGGAALLCWVAREVMPDRWLEMRKWMLTKAPERLWAFYRDHGPAIADYIRSNPWKGQRVRKLMEAVLV